MSYEDKQQTVNNNKHRITQVGYFYFETLNSRSVIGSTSHMTTRFTAQLKQSAVSKY